jgi:hypothetical protein
VDADPIISDLHKFADGQTIVEGQDR